MTSGDVQSPLRTHSKILRLSSGLAVGCDLACGFRIRDIDASKNVSRTRFRCTYLRELVPGTSLTRMRRKRFTRISPKACLNSLAIPGALSATANEIMPEMSSFTKSNVWPRTPCTICTLQSSSRGCQISSGGPDINRLRCQDSCRLLGLARSWV